MGVDRDISDKANKCRYITDVSKLGRDYSATCGDVTKSVARLLLQFVARLTNLWRGYLWRGYSHPPVCLCGICICFCLIFIFITMYIFAINIFIS